MEALVIFLAGMGIIMAFFGIAAVILAWMDARLRTWQALRDIRNTPTREVRFKIKETGKDPE